MHPAFGPLYPRQLSSCRLSHDRPSEDSVTLLISRARMASGPCLLSPEPYTRPLQKASPLHWRAVKWLLTQHCSGAGHRSGFRSTGSATNKIAPVLILRISPTSAKGQIYQQQHSREQSAQGLVRELDRGPWRKFSDARDTLTAEKWNHGGTQKYPKWGQKQHCSRNRKTGCALAPGNS